jgi:uncharacterized iron-regulated membrane protein
VNRPTWAWVHRWLAIVLVVLLAVWSVTGLLFHLKPGWDRAYDMLSVDRQRPLPALPATLTSGDVTRLEVFDTAIGPLARLGGTTPRLVDAATGTQRSPLSIDDARMLVADAVARSPHAAAYGEVGDVSATDASVRIRYANSVVDIDRTSARISQRGADTDRIDWLYRIHYLQWTGNRTVDRVLSVAGLLLIWAVIVPGLVLFVRRLRHSVAG